MSSIDFDKIARQMYAEGTPVDRIAKVFGTTNTSVNSVIHSAPKTTAPVVRDEAVINQDAFDVVDTPEKSYWLGYMYACGFTEGPHLVVTSKEEGHLEGLESILSDDDGLVESYDVETITGSKIATYTSLKVESESVVESLSRLGVKSERSMDMTHPKLPEPLVRDFVRGVVDSSAGTLTPVLLEVETTESIAGWMEKHMPAWFFLPLDNGMWRGYPRRSHDRDRLLYDMYSNAPVGAYKLTNYELAMMETM